MKPKQIPSGFSQPDIHIAMLRDEARTLSYLKAIRETVCEGDVVLDIGTGTGVLAVAAVEAGAKKVYAIEANSEAACYAQNLFENSPCRDQIELIDGWSTEIELPEKCDVLISEVIGNEILDEDVISVTSDAISRHLKPEPRLIPSRLDIYGWPVEVPSSIRQKYIFVQDEVARWEKNYGLCFDSLLSANPLQVCASYLPQKMVFWNFIGDSKRLVSIDLALKSPSPIDERFAFQLGEDKANGMGLFFELMLGEQSYLSTHPNKVLDSNHWRSPLYLWNAEYKNTFAVTYRHGMHGQSNGLYLQDK